MADAPQLRKWTERSFSFGYAPDAIPFLVERLLSTGPRIAELINNVAQQDISFKPGAKWSVKEHIGHLTDLEELHKGRLVDFYEGLETLRAADMANAKTEKADHNSQAGSELLSQFRASRRSFLKQLSDLDEATLLRRSLHPRLKELINIADMLYFIAEHDTHHLTHMSALLNTQR